ncbi:hypothetical protein DXG01_007776, partial [Tephrocybe rancida]
MDDNTQHPPEAMYMVDDEELFSHALSYCKLPPTIDPGHRNAFGNRVHISTESITPDCAQLHMVNRQHALLQTLMDWGFAGCYSFHSGFDEATIHLQEPEQEIYIVLDSEVPDGLCAALEEVVSPFPAIVVTPNDMCAYECQEGNQAMSTQFYDIGPSGLGTPLTESSQGDNGGGNDQAEGSNWKCKEKSEMDQGEGGGSEGRGSGREGGSGGGGSGGAGGAGAGGSGGGSGGGDSGGGSGDGGDGNGGGGSGGGGGGGRGDADTDGEDDGRGDGLDDRHNQTLVGGADHGSIQIPFSSSLVSKDRKERFEISAHITVTVHVVASSCRTTVIDWSPGVVHAEDSSKYREEQNITGTASMTLSMNPSVRVDGKIGSTKGTERTQQPWVINSHRLGRVDGLAEGSKGVLWNYTRNLGNNSQPLVMEDFVSKPSLLFALGNVQSRRLTLPKLEIRVVIFWSSEKRSLSRSFRPKMKAKSEGLPANLNFLHRISMVVDLRELEGDDGVLDGDIADEIPSLS